MRRTSKGSLELAPFVAFATYSWTSCNGIIDTYVRHRCRQWHRTDMLTYGSHQKHAPSFHMLTNQYTPKTAVVVKQSASTRVSPLKGSSASAKLPPANASRTRAKPLYPAARTRARAHPRREPLEGVLRLGEAAAGQRQARRRRLACLLVLLHLLAAPAN